jgi:ATP-dependent Lon protease
MTILNNSFNQGRHPVVSVREGVVFPNTENVLIFGRKKSTNAIEEALKKDKKIILLMQKNSQTDNPQPKDLYWIGVLAEIKKTALGDKGEINALVKGLKKISVLKFIKEEPYFEAEWKKINDQVVEDEEMQAMIKYISSQVKKAINLGKTLDLVSLMNVMNVINPLDFSYQVAVILDIKNTQKQALLEETNVKERLRKEIDYIDREVKILEIEHNISFKTQKKFEEGMKETLLREKKRTIEEELGERGEDKEISEYRQKIKKAKMPPLVEEKALKELKRLAQMSQFNPETSYLRTYLDWLVEMPWSTTSKTVIDIKKAEKILDEDHYGLKKIKERILEYLAVLELRKRLKPEETSKHKSPTILCFVGPPGVGKTSLGRSIARSLGRKFVKMSLGGIRDEAEIRGHRRTYVGALPGRIIQGIKQAGSKNPVFMLDEIDKVGQDHRGDPSAALLEALDPEQNSAFSDHYLEVPFDLSDVFFITTANILDTIPSALLDRLEVIHFPGYTEEEKFFIAKQYLLSKQLEAHHLKKEEVKMSSEAINTIIRRYTREAGVRELERQIAAVFRKIAREIVEKKFTHISITIKDLHRYLGPFKYSSQMIEEKDTIGICTGLAWTPVGGDILFIEVSLMPGKGSLTLTGQLGDVMKESCQAALSYIRSHWQSFGLEKNFYSKMDIHIHVPEGAVPKDGPSAGIAIITAMVSALTKTPVRRDVAMTGEITLRGRVLEIGGVKEKVIAAHRAQIKTVILPKDNKKDLEDIPKNVLNDLQFIFAQKAEDALKVALLKTPVKR